MSTPIIQTSFATGEVGPSLFGRPDLPRFHSAAATMRNLFVSYRGGAYSRAGTAFVGYSKQTGRSYPPRMMSFQFSIKQGLALEFGHHYMRVISNGAYVVENAVVISAVSQSSPCHVTASATGAMTVTPITSGVVSSYAPGEAVTIAGGVYGSPAVVGVTNTTLIGLQIDSFGSGIYAPGDIVNLAGGTQTSPATITVGTTRVVAATIAAAGSGGANGSQTVTGTTGTGTKFQAKVTITGGAITSVDSILVGGSYTVNPTTPASEPVTGAGLTGAALDVMIGIATFTITAGGSFTANPSGLTFTQASTSGSGTGATFQYALMAPNAVSITTPGTYTTFPPNPVSQASSTGTGLGIQFTFVTGSAAPYVNGDSVYISGVSGMTELNGRTFVVGNSTPTSFDLFDVFGAPIDATGFSAYSGGGIAERIFTLSTPYDEKDLKYLKTTQSADVMTVCCVNQESLVEYEALDFARKSNTNWTIASVTPAATIVAPTSVVASPTHTGNYVYAYQVTSINKDDGTESVGSDRSSMTIGSVNIALTEGSISVSWGYVPKARAYNVYKSTPSQSVAPPIGALFGYVGTVYGTQFIDNNVVPDFAQVPPQHRNPFTRGAIKNITIISQGAYYTYASIGSTSTTGSGLVAQAVLSGGRVTGFVIFDAGHGYKSTDTFFVTGDGSWAIVTVEVGPETGTYPSVVAYYQQRRVFASSLNKSDTYWMSQPGSFTNFDSRIPVIDTDAITGTPWSLQVNGIQFMVRMPSGLIVLTGSGAWHVTGAGSGLTAPQPISPQNQQAQPQAYNGSSATVPPIQIGNDVLYVQSKGSIVSIFQYDFFTNIYNGSDYTRNSPHLFLGYTIKEWAWCEEPHKVLWAVRDDGILLSLTHLAAEKVAGWSRHDTAGQFQSVCSIVEQPVDALYFCAKRNINGKSAYMIERMNNRIWRDVEDVWAVDCGLRYPMPAPNSTLTISSATGLGEITGADVVSGGSGYSAGTTATVVDQNGIGPGTGAVPTLAIVGGVIDAVTFAPGQRGTGYVDPRLVVVDPANSGRGASIALALSNAATATTSPGVFSPSSVGKIIRAGAGRMRVSVYISATTATVEIIDPIEDVVPNAETDPIMFDPGSWTMTEPTSTVGGLHHLIGEKVTGLADGNPIPPTTVDQNGRITLGAQASSIVVGLGFQAQLQSIDVDVGQPTVAGQRKKIAVVTARVEASRGLKIGANQPNGSTMNPPKIAPRWSGLVDVPDRGKAAYNSDTKPLYTGDIRIPVQGGFATPGQVCMQQDYPLPMNVLAFIPEVLSGDIPEQEARPRRQRQEQPG